MGSKTVWCCSYTLLSAIRQPTADRLDAICLRFSSLRDSSGCLLHLSLPLVESFSRNDVRVGCEQLFRHSRLSDGSRHRPGIYITQSLHSASYPTSSSLYPTNRVHELRPHPARLFSRFA